MPQKKLKKFWNCVDKEVSKRKEKNIFSSAAEPSTYCVSSQHDIQLNFCVVLTELSFTLKREAIEAGGVHSQATPPTDYSVKINHLLAAIADRKRY